MLAVKNCYPVDAMTGARSKTLNKCNINGPNPIQNVSTKIVEKYMFILGCACSLLDSIYQKVKKTK